MRLSFFRKYKGPISHVDITWEQLVENLSKHDVGTNKFENPAFSPAFYDIDEFQRLNENVRGFSLWVGDFDKFDEDGVFALINRVEELGWSMVLYSTWSHEIEPYCVRPVFPLSRVALPEEWPVLWRVINKMLGGQTDKSCKDLSRLYFVGLLL